MDRRPEVIFWDWEASGSRCLRWGGVGVPFYRVPSNVLSVLVQVAAATEALEVTIMTKLDEAKASGNAQGAITLEGLKATLEEMFAAAKAEVRIAAFAALCWSDT